MASVVLEAAEAKRRLTGPYELEERLALLRREIEATAVAEDDVAGSETGKPRDRSGDIQRRRVLLREWLRLAPSKMDLDLSGMSECYRSAEAFSRILLEDDAEQEPDDWRPTWQESRELEKRLDCLNQQMNAAALDELFAEELVAAGEADEQLLRTAVERRQALQRAHRRLVRTKRDPDFSGMTESERAAEAERLRQERLQKARRLIDEGDVRGGREHEGVARILDFDPKQGGIYLNSIYPVDLTAFDHTEESPVGPMRFTDRVSKGNKFVPYAAINILSVKIACSDIDFPIQLYGTVVARDCVDYKRVYLFRRDSDHCQLINSTTEALILSGPKRGLALSYRDDYIETDLWVKDCQGHCREFSKGIVRIPGTATQSLDKCEAERVSLATRLSTMDVMYDVVKCAVEATIAAEVIQGEFFGLMAAYTTSSERRIVLYDSKVAGGSCHGVIQLMRPAVSVYAQDKLRIIAKPAASNCGVGLEFTPYWNGGDENVLTLGDTMIRVKVAWSMMMDT